MIKLPASAILVFIASLLFAQADPDELRIQFKQQYDSGHYDEALLKVDTLIAFWKQQGVKDSINFYRYRRAHTLSVDGEIDSSVTESMRLIATLEANPPLPGFMGGVYFTAGSTIIYLSEFSKATELLNKSIAFETGRADPDTLILAKATEWKGIVCIYTDELEKAQELAEHALDLRYAICDSSAKEIAYNLNTLGNIYDTRGFKPKAEKAFEEAYRILKIYLPPDHPQLSILASNLATIKSDLGEINAALELLQEAIAVHEKQNAAYQLMAEYNNLGGIYTSSLQDNKRGRIYFKRSLHLADSLLPKPHLSRANLYDGIGASYYNESRYLKADSFFVLAYQERKGLPEVPVSELGQSTYNLGITADERRDTARARKYYSKSYQYRLTAYGLDHIQTANSLYGLANIDWMEGKTEESLRKFHQTLNIYTANLGTINKWPLENMMKLAGCYQQLDKPDSSQSYLTKAWEGVCETNGEPIDLNKLSEYPIRFVDPYVLDIIDFNLDQLIKNHELIGSGNDQAGLELMKTMDNLMTELWPMLNFDNETTPLLPKIKSIYRKGVYLASLSGESDDKVKMLYLNSLEQSRSASIRSALQNREAMHYAHVPDSVVEHDRKLREQLRFVRARAKNEYDENWDKIKFETFNRWRTYQQHIQTRYPEWYQARYAPDIPDLGEMQNNLKRNNASLVAYFVSDTATVVLIADSTHFHSQILPLPESWQDSVRTYRNLTQQRANPVRIGKLSHYLYTLFWQPIEQKINSNVMLVPDRALNFLNFETLVSTLPQTTEYADWDWLLKKYTFLIRSSLPGKQKPTKTEKYEVLAMAPGFSDELKSEYTSKLDSSEKQDTTFTRWVQTPWSVEFAEELKPKGKIFVGINATKSAFRENAAEAEILHFGTHAQLRDTKPLMSYLALTPKPENDDDGYLYAYELYNQPLNAQLAVLTACETGLGTYREGDGVMSLAHAFQYAGCPNVVYSLWQIDDKQSTWLMKKFYGHLEENKPFSQALRQAKLNYLSAHSGELNAPYYWGGVVLTGEDGQIPAKAKFFGRYWWLVLVGLVIVIIAARRRKGKKRG